MKHLLILCFCLLPAAASATKLANCDSKSYEVTINNAGQVHTVTLTPGSGSIEEFGPRVSMQIKGHAPVVITNPRDEYCIWSGTIKIQRRDFEDSGGFGAR